VLGRMTRNIKRDDKVAWKTLSVPRRMTGALGQGKAPLPKQKRNLGQMERLEWLLRMFQGFKTSLLVIILLSLYYIQFPPLRCWPQMLHKNNHFLNHRMHGIN
jgi:hypothetical protein